MALLTDFAIQTSIQRGEWGVVREARERGRPWGALVSTNGVRAMHQAIFLGDEPQVERFLAMEAPLGNYLINGTEHSLLWDALVRRLDRAATALLKAGANPDERQLGGAERRPLTEASVQVLPQATLELLRRGPTLRTLPTAQQVQVLEAWGQALLVPAQQAGARQVLAAIQASGWTPALADTTLTDLGPIFAAVMNDGRCMAADHALLGHILGGWRRRVLALAPATSNRHERHRS